MCVKPRTPPGRADVRDLSRDPVVAWQRKYYFPLAFFGAVVLPVVVCGFGWGDWRGGVYIAGMARVVFVHHVSTCDMFLPEVRHFPFCFFVPMQRGICTWTFVFLFLFGRRGGVHMNKTRRDTAQCSRTRVDPSPMKKKGKRKLWEMENGGL